MNVILSKNYFCKLIVKVNQSNDNHKKVVAATVTRTMLYETFSTLLTAL